MEQPISSVKVLVLDANQRSSLAVIRSLGAIKRLVVHSCDSEPQSIGGSSKYSHQYYQHPSINHTPKEFLSWLKQLIATESFDIVFPCTEVSSQLLLMYSKVLGSAKLPFASLETVMSLANKGKLTKLAESIDVACPISVHYQSASEVNLNSIKKYPVVVKPNLSKLWRDDGWEDTVVEIAKNESELKEILKQTPWIQNDPFMLQEFVSGHGAGIFAIYNKGRAIAFFAHQRLREKPPQGGVSVLSCSKPLDPKLLKNAKKLLDSVEWHGVAMVEFRVAADGSPYLMEVNTRFWGSLQLAIDSGVNFPELLYKITQDQQVPQINQYSENTRLRWLLGDLDSLYLVLKSSRYSLKEKLSRIVSFFVPHFFTTHHQVDRLGDLGPAITEFKQYIRDLRGN